MGSMFDPHAYGDEIAGILALDGSGERLMPLAGGTGSSAEARRLLKASRLRPAVLAGLYLYFSCWDEAHGVAQDLDTPEGSYWHALVHRQEPDAGNSGYWFRRVGQHPIYPSLRTRAAEIGVESGDNWDPFAFIDYCEAARNRADDHPGVPGRQTRGQTHPTGYNVSVEKAVRVFASFEDADEADARYDAAMSSEERLSILIELRNRRHPDAAEQRLARVYRVVERERS